MAESKAPTPKSFRITDEMAQKIKDISESLGKASQQETMAKLIEVYEFQAGKVALTDHKADIEQFERYTTAITRMYMQSLETNHNTKETVQAEYDALLKSKDDVIRDLQGKMATVKQSQLDAEAQAKAYADENAKLCQDLATVQTLNQALTDACDSFKAKVETLESTAAQAESFRKQLETLEAEQKETLREKADLQNQLQQAQNDQTRIQERLQLEHDKAILELKQAHQKALEDIKTQAQADIDAYQARVATLLQDLQAQTVAKDK